MCNYCKFQTVHKSNNNAKTIYYQHNNKMRKKKKKKKRKKMLEHSDYFIIKFTKRNRVNE